MRYHVKLLIGLIVTIIVGLALMPSQTAKPTQVVIDSVSEKGLLENPVRPEFIRDGGASAMIGNKILWTFGDTLFNPASVDGSNGRSNTAAFAQLNNPFSLTEPLDANKAPYQFVPFSSSDTAYNASKRSGSDRYAIWINSVIPRPDQQDALVYFLRLKVNPGNLNYDLLNTGIAVVSENSTTAAVVLPELFAKPEPLFNGIKYLHDGMIYVGDCTTSLSPQCSIGRVALADALDKSKYKFWDGKTWQSNISARATNLPGRGSGYSEIMQKFVMFYNAPFTGEIYLRTATQPQGPWSSAQKIYTAPKDIYAVEYHPEVKLEDPNAVYLTYYQEGLHNLKVTVSADYVQSLDEANQSTFNTANRSLLRRSFLVILILAVAALVTVLYSRRKALQTMVQQLRERRK